jgi:hypothetical protein
MRPRVPARWSLGRPGSIRSLVIGSVLGVMAILGGAPGAGGDARPVAAAQAQPGTSPALPQEDDLTLAGAAGSTLIGLTVRPAQPGPNRVLVYVLPLAGPGVAADVPVSLTVGGQSVPVDFCSRSCRAADVALFGGEHLDVVAGGPEGGIAGFDLPALPAADGTSLLQLVQERMHRLRSYRIDEVLGPATSPLQSTYAFQAPDRMRFDLATGSQTIFVGTTRYTRRDPSSAWQSEQIGVSLTVPSFTWDTGPATDAPVAAHVVASAEVDGVPAQILAFFQGTPTTPLWFRLWVDAEGLVRRAEMHAQGHFMDDHFTDFDAPLAIDPPTT